MSTISTTDEDYLLNTSRPEEMFPRQVVTVSAIDELQSALRERDSRIAFLEKELIETRLQLACTKSSEDCLKLELRKTSHALASARSTPISTSDLSWVSAEEGEVRRLPIVPPDEPLQGNTARMPMGQHTIPISYSRKRNVQSNSSMDSWNNINPSSCASGLDLLAGAIPQGGSSMNLALNSSSSINRMLGDIGLVSSEHSLKKRKSGDVAAGGGGHRIIHTTHGQYHSNEGWGDAGIAAPPQGNMFANARSQGNMFASATIRPQGNMFANATRFANAARSQGNNMFPSATVRPQGNMTRAVTRPQENNVFANVTARPQENIFAGIIRSSMLAPTVENPPTAASEEPTTATLLSELQRQE